MPTISNKTSDASSQARTLTALALLWLAGCALRLTILAVPPVIPRIHDALHLSATQIGILTGLPSMLFAGAAVPGSLLIARLGVRAALVVGLALTAIGGALRGALPDIAWLYAMTIVMGAGVAIMQVTMPPAVRAWVPQRIGFATAVYTNGLLIGEILPVALMLPLVLPLVGGSWQWGFVVWSVPVALIAVPGTCVGAKRKLGRMCRRRAAAGGRNGTLTLIWRLGIMLGTINAIYFSTNAFLPDYLRSNGQGDWISAGAHRLQRRTIAGVSHSARRRWPAGAQGLALCHLRPIVPDCDRRASCSATSAWIVAAAGLQGFSAAADFDPRSGAAALAQRA